MATTEFKNKECPVCGGCGGWHKATGALCINHDDERGCAFVATTCPLCDGTGKVSSTFGNIIEGAS